MTRDHVNTTLNTSPKNCSAGPFVYTMGYRPDEYDQACKVSVKLLSGHASENRPKL